MVDLLKVRGTGLFNHVSPLSVVLRDARSQASNQKMPVLIVRSVGPAPPSFNRSDHGRITVIARGLPLLTSSWAISGAADSGVRQFAHRATREQISRGSGALTILKILGRKSSPKIDNEHRARQHGSDETERYCRRDVVTWWPRADRSRISNGESAATRTRDGVMQRCRSVPCRRGRGRLRCAAWRRCRGS